MGRFKIDKIVHASSRSRAEDDFLCPICQCIFDDPVQTTECHHLFCQSCLEEANSAACPSCRDEFPDPGPAWKPLREVSRALLRQLHSLKVYCPHHPDAAEGAAEDGGGEGWGDSAPPSMKKRKVTLVAKGKAAASASKKPEEASEDVCRWEGDYGDLLAKHIGECRLHPVDCPKGCGEKVCRKDLEAHAKGCAMNFVACGICGDAVRPEDMAEHRRVKAELHVQILEKKLAEADSGDRLGRMEAALGRLGGMEAALGLLEKKAAKADRDMAKVKNDLGRLVPDLEAVKSHPAVTSKAVWKVNVAAALQTASAPGIQIVSPEMPVLGGVPISFALYPHGKNSGYSGNVSIYIHCHAMCRGSFAVRDGATELGRLNFMDALLDLSQGYGRPRAMTSEAFAELESVTVEAEIRELQAYSQFGSG